MKNLLLIFLFLFSALVLNIKSESSYNTQVVITIPNLTNESLVYLNKEFKKYSHINYVDGSIEGNTIALNIDDGYYDQKQVESMLRKWNCEAASFEYNNIADIAIIE